MVNIALLQGGEYLIQYAEHALAGAPFGCGAEQVLLGDHLKDGPDVLGHAAVDKHEAILKSLARLCGSLGRSQDTVLWHEAPAADADLGIAFRSEHPLDELHARPDAAGILPAAT